MLDGELSVGDAHVAPLVCLVAVEVASGGDLAVGDFHLVAREDADLAIAVGGGESENDVTAYNEVIQFTQADKHACGFWPHAVARGRFPSQREAVADGDAQAVGCDEFGLARFVVEKHSVEVVGALALEDERLGLAQQPIG